MLRLLAERHRYGSLSVVLPDGSRHDFKGSQPGPSATWMLNRSRVARRVLVDGSMGLAESYMDGDWTSPDLASLIELLDRNVAAAGHESRLSRLRRIVERVRHAMRANSLTGSRRNIQAHYDLGNAFFSAWLDPTLTYSSALFAGEQDDLETAQRRKYRTLAERVRLAPGMRILEIGTGWGGFALTAAKEFGAKVTSITISQEQHDHAARRVQEAGLGEQVEVRLQDYRNVDGRFDRITSIEMFEAVGEEYWPIFFGRLRELLAADGWAGLQIITIADRWFESYRRNVDFIQKYIFPGGMLPSPGVLKRLTAAAGLAPHATHFFGGSYARTLAEWHRRFDRARPQVTAMGFDDRFQRMWKYYLAYCEAGFRSGSIDVGHFIYRPA
jgi:cyclopropane-fatty-acyl-phospholipid synthase